MEQDINQLIEQVLAIHKGENLIKATSVDGQEVWVCLDDQPTDALRLAARPVPMETFEMFRTKR